MTVYQSLTELAGKLHLAKILLLIGRETSLVTSSRPVGEPVTKGEWTPVLLDLQSPTSVFLPDCQEFKTSQRKHTHK